MLTDCTSITTIITSLYRHSSFMQSTSTEDGSDLQHQQQQQRADDHSVARHTERVHRGFYLSVATSVLDQSRTRQENNCDNPRPDISIINSRGRDPNLQPCSSTSSSTARGTPAVSDAGDGSPSACCHVRGGCAGGECDETFEQREERMRKRTRKP